MKSVYLAGPIWGCSDAEAMGWRDRVSSVPFRSMDIFDPMDRDCRGGGGLPPQELVDADKADIRSADFVLANCWKPSTGTSMEIFYACQQGKKVVCVTEHPSPWIIVHATEVVPDVERAIDWIRESC